jgi:hypothetical protein
VDRALGTFSTSERTVLAPFELKGPKTHDLDAIMPGRNKSPVQQAWEYAIDAPGRIAKYRDEHRLNEFVPDGRFLGFAKVGMARLLGPILRSLELQVRWFENYLGEFALDGLAVEQSSSAAKIEAFL